jgi:hydroxyethylthiazole kinase-like uncharacterized protein yjeF
MLTGGLKVLNAEQMRNVDSYTINSIGIPGVVLMENAGRAVVDAMEDFFEGDGPMRVAVFCGKGNNGGDGFVIARHLAARGHDPVIILLTQMEQLQGDALINAEIAEKIGLEIREVPGQEALSSLDYDPRDFEVIVDAIFGTGLNSAVRGHYLGAIDLINSSGVPVVAVDIPSGLSSDSGELMGPAIEADLTVTFAYPKLGLILAPASTICGEVVVADISIPESAEGIEMQTYLITDDLVSALHLPREKDSHKGTYGHLLVVAGAPGKAGAAAMVGKSALRAGSGLVTVGVSADILNTVDSMAMETMTTPLASEAGLLTVDALDSILEALRDKTSLALGPGMGTEEKTCELVKELVARVEVPMVLDADAVNAFAGNSAELKSDLADIVITPHPGEMARLLGIKTEEVQRDRIEIARELAKENNIIVVLKGYRTIIASPEGEVFINMTGNPGMATAGSGDVLTGLIGSYLGMKDLTPLEAVVAAVYLHGLAGDLAAEEKGQNALIAGDLIEHLSDASLVFEKEE